MLLPGTSFAVVAMSSVCPPLGLSTAGRLSFQEFSSALLATWDQKVLYSTGGAVSQFLAWVWANWALGLAKFLF